MMNNPLVLQNQSINITWDEIDDSDLDYYILYRLTTTGNNSTATMSISNIIENNYTDYDLESDTGYDYSISGVDVHGNEGDPSSSFGIESGTLSIGDVLPESFMLYSAYPNPFNPNTTIKFDISKTSNVNINIYDMNGNLVDQILSKTMVQGTYEIIWNAASLSSGVYLIHMNTIDGMFTEKVLLVK